MNFRIDSKEEMDLLRAALRARQDHLGELIKSFGDTHVAQAASHESGNIDRIMKKYLTDLNASRVEVSLTEIDLKCVAHALRGLRDKFTTIYESEIGNIAFVAAESVRAMGEILRRHKQPLKIELRDPWDIENQVE